MKLNFLLQISGDWSIPKLLYHFFHSRNVWQCVHLDDFQLETESDQSDRIFFVMLLFHQLRCFGPKKPDIEKLTEDELFPSYLFNWQNKHVHFWCLPIARQLESLGCGNGGLVVRIVSARLGGQGFNLYNLQPFFRRTCPSKMFIESEYSGKGRRKK